MSEVSLSLPAENSTGKCVKSIMQWVDALFSFLFLSNGLIRKVTRVFFFVIRKARKILYGNFTLTFLCFRPCSSSLVIVKEQCVCYESKT